MVNKKEYGSLKKKTQLQRKFPEPAASWLHTELSWGKYGFHQHPNTSPGPDKEELHLDLKSEDSSTVKEKWQPGITVSQAALLL